MHLQCFAGRTGCTHGTTADYCVAGKRAQYRNIRTCKKKIKVSNTRALSLTPWKLPPHAFLVQPPHPPINVLKQLEMHFKHNLFFKVLFWGTHHGPWHAFLGGVFKSRLLCTPPDHEFKSES